jgi:hypothetical protein
VAPSPRHHLVDDLDGHRWADETVEFGLDGHRYRINLCGDNARELRAVLALFVAAARPGSNRRPRNPPPDRTPGRPAPRTHQREVRDHNQKVREWAREHYIPVDSRGRIPEKLKELYTEERGDVTDQNATVPWPRNRARTRRVTENGEGDRL